MKYKFRGGQSSFAINFWDEALATKKLSYVFNCPIASVKDNGHSVEVNSEDGRQFQASRVVCTIPLNVLNTVTFTPPLSPQRSAAINTGHLNQCVKVHAEVSNKDLRSWSGVDPSSKLLYAFGDGTTPAGNTHIVAFGANETHLDPEQDVKMTAKILTDLVDMDIKRLVSNRVLPFKESCKLFYTSSVCAAWFRADTLQVFHNWSQDKYAKGAWFFPGKDFVTKNLEELRARHGNIFFANSDWAVGWRSFIDGAIEEGTRAALDVRKDLFQLKPVL
jgi:hypothetical protein